MFGGSRRWSDQTVIKHQWHEVMKSVQFKYPNPYNGNVLNIDVLSREVDARQGTMRTCKLINSAWAVVPHLGHLKAIEYSCIHVPEQKMISRTVNIDLRGVLTGIEDIEYSVHPENSNWTLLKHTVDVDAFSLIAISALSVSKQAAVQGVSALQWVIKHRLPVLNASNQEDYRPMETMVPSISNDTHAYTEKNSSPNPFLYLSGPLDNPKPRHTFILGNLSQSMKSSTFSDSSIQKPYPNRTSSFFADLPSPATTIATNSNSSGDKPTLPSSIDTSNYPASTDSPRNYLESHLETFSRDVTAITDAVVRRSQRVARLFSRIDEYVVIM